MDKTTIQINKDTLERLKMFKQHERDPYDATINILLDEAEEDVLSDEEIEDIQEALEQIKKGEVYPIEDVARELGIELE